MNHKDEWVLDKHIEQYVCETFFFPFANCELKYILRDVCTGLKLFLLDFQTIAVHGSDLCQKLINFVTTL